MTAALKARDAKDVEDAVRWALAEGKTLEVAGRGTKRALGRPSQSDLTLDLSGLSGVIDKNAGGINHRLRRGFAFCRRGFLCAKQAGLHRINFHYHVRKRANQ